MNTDTEPVKAMTEETIASLEQFWKQIGTTPDESAHELTKLHETVASVFEGTLLYWKQNMKGLEEGIMQNKATIKELAFKLGEEDHVLEQVCAINESQESLRWIFSEIEVVLDSLQQKETLRFDVLSGILGKIQALYGDFGWTASDPFVAIGEKLTSDKVELFEAELGRLEAERINRVDQVAFLVAEVCGLWKELAIKAEDCTLSIERAILEADTKLGITDTTLSQLHERKDALITEKTRRLKIVDSYTRQIQALWERLEMDVEHRRAFSQRVSTGVTSLDVVSMYGQEVADMELLKISKLQELVLAARAQVVELQSQLRMNETQQRAEFPLAFTSDFSEESLEAHEKYTQVLTERMAQFQPILDLVNKRETMIADIKEFHATAEERSQQRLAEPRKAYQILAFEEKMRKNEKKALPVLETKLLKRISAWELKHGMEFLIDGKLYATVIQGACDTRSSKTKSKQQSNGIHGRAEMKTSSSSNSIAASACSTPSTTRQHPPRSESTPNLSGRSTARRPNSTLKKKSRIPTSTMKQRKPKAKPKAIAVDAPPCTPTAVPMARTPTRSEQKGGDQRQSLSPGFPSQDRDDELREMQAAPLPDTVDENVDCFNHRSHHSSSELEELEKLKQQAHHALEQGENEKALELFTAAIKNIKIGNDTAELATDLYHGRSKVYNKLAMLQESLDDSDKALEFLQANQ